MTKFFQTLFSIFLIIGLNTLPAQAKEKPIKQSPETHTDATGSLAFAGYDRAPVHHR